MIKLGSKVQDQITGFKGIAIQRLDQLNGNTQIAIQPESEDGRTYPEAMFIDHHTIVAIGDGVSKKQIDPPEVNIKLGQKVRDKASGFTGIAIQKATYINGCVSFAVIPPVRKESLLDNVPDACYIDHTRLEVVSNGIAESVPEIKEEPSKSRPGGPAQRVPRSV